MAKGRIEKGDIVQEGILKDFNKEILETSKNITTLELAMKSVQETAKKSKKDFSTIKPKDVKTIDQFNALTEKANKNAENRIQINKQLLTEKEKLAKAQREQNKAIKLEVALGDKQLDTLDKIRARNSQLAAAKGKVSFKTKEGKAQLKKMNDELNRNNKILEKNASKLGKQKIGIGRYSKAVAGLRSGLAQLGLGLGVFSILKSSFNIVKDFEQGQADLASVLGISVDQMGKLTEQAKRLGATTTFTASQVSELQKEYAKLGFTQSEIEGVTEATLLLAEATGTELGRAAEVTGATIRGFGLTADDTQRVVDVMAKSFSSSSLDMEKFATAMSAVAPVAKNAGFSIEQTTALIGTLTDRGIDASSAGTGLRNMFLDAKKNGLSFNEALEQINGASDKTAESFKLFGKRGATLGVILAENGASVDDLTGKLLDSDEAAKDMAETQRATLGGAIKLLTSAWEGWILKMNESGGVGEWLRKKLVFLADNLDTILTVLKNVVKGIIAFKVAMKALKINESIGGLKGLGDAFKSMAKGATGASEGAKKLGASLKQIGWAAVLVGMMKLAEMFWSAATGARQLRIEAEQMAAQTGKAEKSGNKYLDDLTKRQNDKIEAIKNERRLKKISAEEELRQILAVNEATKVQLEKDIRAVKKRRSANIKTFLPLKRELEKLQRKTSGVATQISSDLANALGVPSTWLPKSKQDYLKLSNMVADYHARVEAGQVKIDLYTTALGQLGKQVVNSSTDLEVLNMETQDVTVSIEGATEALKEFNSVALEDKGVLTVDMELPDTNRQNAERNVLLAEYNVLIADSETSEEEMNNLLTRQILAKAELEKLDKTAAEQQVIDQKALKEINALTTKEIENTIDLAKMRREALEFTSDLAVKLIDERIKKLDEETEAHIKQAETLKTLAENGSIEAKESIAEENRLAAENELKKQELEKRKQRILLVTSVLQAYNANMESGMESGEALTSAITSKAVLDQFIASIGSAYEGTEDTGTTNNPLDSNGGRVMLIHDNERVMTKKQNAMIGGVSNDYVAQVMEQHRLGNYMDGSQLVGKIGNAELVNGLSSLKTEMNEVKQAIINKPVESNNTAEMLSNYMMFEKKVMQGGKRTTSRFKVQK